VRDLASASAIYAKGILFVVMSILAAMLLLLQQPNLSTALLLVVVAWASARAYYFAFYVIERYVDPSFRYSGIVSLLTYIVRRRKPR
jgi:hypothetical protein